MALPKTGHADRACEQNPSRRAGSVHLKIGLRYTLESDFRLCNALWIVQQVWETGLVLGLPQSCHPPDFRRVESVWRCVDDVHMALPWREW